MFRQESLQEHYESKATFIQLMPCYYSKCLYITVYSVVWCFLLVVCELICVSEKLQ
jgi:hypothetical protein